MQKKLFAAHAAAVIALAGGFTACSSELDGTDNTVASEQLTLTSVVDKATTAGPRRVANNSNLQSTQLVSGLQAGVFLMQDDAIMANGNNVQLTADGNGGFTYASRMTWPSNGTVSVYAYAPYNAAWTPSADNAFSVAADQSEDAGYLASDLVYGVPTATNPVTRTTDGNVAMSFSHKLAKLNIDIVSGDDAINLKGATVNVLNTLPTTSLNLTTGALGTATGTATTIKAAIFSSTATAFKSSVILVPQTVNAGTQLVQIRTADKTYTAKLPADVTFESGKEYTYTVNVGMTDLTLGGGTVNPWTSTTGMESDAEESDTPVDPDEPVVYGVGDYLLANGTLLKANAVTDANKDQLAAVIFTTKVSDTDAAAGYGAYAMALKRYTNRTFIADTNYPSQLNAGNGVNDYAAALADLDGLTKTQAMLASDYYNARTDDEKAAFIANLSGYTPALSGSNNSGWFLPSFGQMAVIMQSVVGLTLPDTSDDTIGTGSGSAMYTSTGALTESILNAFTAAWPYNATNQFAIGNIVYATSTENGSTSSAHYGKIWNFSFTSAGDWSFGKNTGRSNNGRSVIPVTAVKLPTE